MTSEQPNDICNAEALCFLYIRKLIFWLSKQFYLSSGGALCFVWVRNGIIWLPWQCQTTYSDEKRACSSALPIRKHETLPLKKSNSRGNNGECTRNAMLHVHLLTSIIILLYKHGKGVKCKVMFSKSNVMGMYTYVMGSYNSRNYCNVLGLFYFTMELYCTPKVNTLQLNTVGNSWNTRTRPTCTVPEHSFL
jgi:hypothetical protein